MLKLIYCSLKKGIIFIKYLDFIDIFQKWLALELIKNSSIKSYTINLEVSKYLFYNPFYNLKYLELKTSNIYIKIDLKNSFI